MNPEITQTEKNILKALKHFDAGISVSQILNEFPNERRELSSLLSLASQLNHTGDTLLPRQSVLHNTLSHIASSQTKTSSLWSDIKSILHSRAFKILAPTALLLLLVSGKFLLTPAPTASISPVVILPPIAVAPSPNPAINTTEDVSAIIDSITNDSMQEESTALSFDSDITPPEDAINSYEEYIHDNQL